MWGHTVATGAAPKTRLSARSEDYWAAALVGAPQAAGWPAALLQLTLIVMWNGLAGAGIPGIASIQFWVREALEERRGPDFEWEAFMAFWGFLHTPTSPANMLVLAPLLELVLALAFARIGRRDRGPGLHSTLRALWQACALATPLVALAAAMLPPGSGLVAWRAAASVVACGGLILWLIIGPARLLRLEQHPRPRRRSRWQPVCPECGHGARSLSAGRCLECGAVYPLPHRPRRWAFRRLAWERRPNSDMATRYLSTLATVLLMPRRAGRAIANADRWGEAWRWAIDHLLAAGIGLALGAFVIGPQLARLAQLRIVPDMGPEVNADRVWRYTEYHLIRGVAWTFALTTLPVSGLLLSSLLPGRSLLRSLRCKWTLYCTAITLVAGVALVGMIFCLWYMPTPRGRGWNLFAVSLADPPTKRGVLCVVATCFSVWWASGLSAISVDQHRSCVAFWTYGVLFMAVWIVLVDWLFAPGPLWHLL